MSSTNKLNLKDYVQSDQALKFDNSHALSAHQFQQKPPKNQRKSSNRDNKKLKLNTLPCEEIQKDNNQLFLFRSTWEQDMEHLKEQMKGCTSPTFATEILSHANNHSSLFPLTDQINEHQDESSKRTRVSNSRSKSKHNKSLQKFIGDSVSTHRPSSSTLQKTSTQMGNQNQVTPTNNQQEMYLYEMKKLESVTHELRRENKKLDEKCKQLKERCQQLEEMSCENKNENLENLMTNEVLLQKMRNEGFWKFYLKAEKMIKASMAENNQQSFASPINFMKQLQALREMSSQMKKQNKFLKKTSQQRSEQVQKMKDKLSVQQAQVQQMRLKCVAYESTIKRLREQMSRNSKQLQKLSSLSLVQQKYTQKCLQTNNLSKQVSSLLSQLQEQKLLNCQCQKERLSKKKKCQQLNDEILSLNKQLSAIKTSYNLLQIQKQQLSANKKELIEKQRLKQKVFQLEKEIKQVMQVKEQQIMRMKVQCEARWGKQIQVKESRVKELDSKVEQILGNITQLQSENAMYSEQNKKLSCEIHGLMKENNRLVGQNKELLKQVSQVQKSNSKLNQQLQSIRGQYEDRLKELSINMKNLTQKLNEQKQSLLTQQRLIQELKQQLNQKQQLLKLNQCQSQKLKASLGIIKPQQNSQRTINSKLPKQGNRFNLSQTNNQQKRTDQLQQQAKRLQEKLNEALEMYQQVHNQKVQLQLQLQYAEQEVQKLTIQLQQLTGSTNLNPNQLTYGEQFISQTTTSQQTLQMVENLLTIKEEIIKKILIFCPQNYKALLVQYIYYGDMIKEKYFQIINTQLQNYHSSLNHDDNHQNQTSRDQSYLQPENSNFYHHTQTTRNHFYNHSKSRYNQTKPYQSRNPHYDDEQSSQLQSQPEEINENNSQQDQINYLVEEFLKIGKIIDEQTRTHYQNPKSKERKKPLSGVQLHSSKQKEHSKEQEFRRSKQKQIQQSKNLLNQLNRKIQKVKQNNINNENSFHYQQASQYDKKPIPKINNKNYSQDQKYPSELIQRPNRQPLPLNEDKNQPNVSRPLFTGKDIKIKNPNLMRNHYQEQQNQQREQNLMQRSNMMAVQQTPYQKGSQGTNRDNFNHGVMSKLSMLKISDKIRQ